MEGSYAQTEDAGARRLQRLLSRRLSRWRCLISWPPDSSPNHFGRIRGLTACRIAVPLSAATPRRCIISASPVHQAYGWRWLEWASSSPRGSAPVRCTAFLQGIMKPPNSSTSLGSERVGEQQSVATGGGDWPVAASTCLNFECCFSGQLFQAPNFPANARCHAYVV